MGTTRDHQQPRRPRANTQRFLARFFARFLLGTFAPAARASDSPMAMACLRLLTFFLERPDRSVPAFFSCITFFTALAADGPYFLLDFLRFFAATLHLTGVSLLQRIDKQSVCR